MHRTRDTPLIALYLKFNRYPASLVNTVLLFRFIFFRFFPPTLIRPQFEEDAWLILRPHFFHKFRKCQFVGECGIFNNGRQQIDLVEHAVSEQGHIQETVQFTQLRVIGEETPISGVLIFLFFLSNMVFMNMVTSSREVETSTLCRLYTRDLDVMVDRSFNLVFVHGFRERSHVHQN
jgi:hypothetical protein